MILAVAATVFQSLWRPEQKPIRVQVLFNVATLVLTASLAYGALHGLHRTEAGESLAFVLFVATAVLYFGNTIMVSAAVWLAESVPLSEVWRRCCFWSFPLLRCGGRVRWSDGVDSLDGRMAGFVPGAASHGAGLCFVPDPCWQVG